KLHLVLIFHAHVFQQPDYGGKLNRERNCMNFTIVLLNDFNFPGKEQSEGFLPGDDPEWLVRRIQKQGRMHTKPYLSNSSSLCQAVQLKDVTGKRVAPWGTPEKHGVLHCRFQRRGG